MPTLRHSSISSFLTLPLLSWIFHGISYDVSLGKADFTHWDGPNCSKDNLEIDMSQWDMMRCLPRPGKFFTLLEQAHRSPWVRSRIDTSPGKAARWFPDRWPVLGVEESQRNYGDVDLEPLGEVITEVYSSAGCLLMTQFTSFSIKKASQSLVGSEYDLCTVGLSFPRSVTCTFMLVCLLVVTPWATMIYLRRHSHQYAAHISSKVVWFPTMYIHGRHHQPFVVIYAYLRKTFKIPGGSGGQWITF